MNLRPEQKSMSGKTARPGTGREPAKPAGSRPRPARKLFQPQARPLESGVTPLLAIRRPRRQNRPLAVLGACLVLGGACAAQNLAPATDARAPVGSHEVLEPAGGVLVAASASSRGQSSQGDSRGDRRSDRERDSRRERQRSDSGTSSAGGSTAGVSQGTQKNVENFSGFGLIAERNIFNPNRNPRRPATTESRPRPRVDSFGLVGVMAYEKGTFAFFDGSASEFKKVLKVTDQIAGHTLTEVKSGSVKLFKEGKTLELKVGTQLRREEQGDWVLSSQPQTYAATPGPGPAPSSTPAPASAGPAGDSDDVLKRLMQRREQE